MKISKIIRKGIPSYCTGNLYVIQSLMRIYSALEERYLLIEATANQVNQFGGYTGKRPEDFRKEILEIAKAQDFSVDRLILGGDHLGPLVWRHEDIETALKKAEELVKQFCEAGYQKIHLDTSMCLGNETSLTTETIARRGLRLYKVCQEVLTNKENRTFVIGSEVPIPGGEVNCDTLSVTRPTDALNTISIYKKIFREGGISKREFKKNICALVVQPGIEFTKDNVIHYNRSEARELVGIEKGDLIFEGHSTDYQQQSSLRKLAKDGIKILKVGPELTYMLRIALEKMESVEKKILPSERCSNFKANLISTMMGSPKFWEDYYSLEQSGDFEASYLDRSRYYLTEEKVLASIEKLKENFEIARESPRLMKEFPEITFTKNQLFETVVDYYIGLVVRKYENAYQK